MEDNTGRKTLNRHLQICRNDGSQKPSVIWADYFARFRFNLEELITYLKGISGKAFTEVPFAYQCLDDLGYWTYVRQREIFEFSPELENSLRQQFGFLNSVFDYSVGETLIWGDLRRPQTERYVVRLLERVVEGEQELFRIELKDSGATLLVSRFELDYWNATGSSLPNDRLEESINWDTDQFWLKRLSDFKEKMAEQGFQFNFSAEASVMAEQQALLITEITNFFSLRPGGPSQRGRGLGYFACGQGEYEESALILAFACQALGQPFGIKARLWGYDQGDKAQPSFLLMQTDKSGRSIDSWKDLTLKHPLYRPIQRPLSEVLRKILAQGPFGKEESLIFIRGSLDEPTAQESKIQE